MLSTVVKPKTSIDALEQVLIAGETAIAKIRAHQVAALVDLDRVQVHTGDGARSLHDWVAARLDVTHETAKLLVDASSTLHEHAEALQSLADGVVSFDRALATGKLAASGASADLMAASAGFDLAGVARLAARRRRITSVDERAAFRERFVALQPQPRCLIVAALGPAPCSRRSHGRASTHCPRRVPARDRRRRTSSHRAAAAPDAFVSIVQDSVSDASSNTPAAPSVTIFVDARSRGRHPRRSGRGDRFRTADRAGNPRTIALRRNLPGHRYCWQHTRSHHISHTGNPPSHPPVCRMARWGMRHRGLQIPLPTSTSPHHPQITRWRQRFRQPRHPLLVPPSRHHPWQRVPPRSR